MSEASFLDTSVVLGYCFRDDTHHYKAEQYIEGNDASFYISNHVESEYIHREPTVAGEVSDGILNHVFRLRNSEYEGQLDSMDTTQIRQNLVSRENEANSTLEDFYRDAISNFIQFEDLMKRLRELARDIDQAAAENYNWLMERTTIWERNAAYPEINRALYEIPQDDRRICLDAHDVAEETEQETEIATANPKDFTRDGMRELIITSTSISSIENIAG